MAERKTPNKGYQKLKSDLSAGEIGQVYIFHGEERMPYSRSCTHFQRTGYE